MELCTLYLIGGGPYRFQSGGLSLVSFFSQAQARFYRPPFCVQSTQVSVSPTQGLEESHPASSVGTHVVQGLHAI